MLLYPPPVVGLNVQELVVQVLVNSLNADSLEFAILSEPEKVSMNSDQTESIVAHLQHSYNLSTIFVQAPISNRRNGANSRANSICGTGTRRTYEPSICGTENSLIADSLRCGLFHS